MLTSYMTDKECFCFLYELLGGKKEDIPDKLIAGVSLNNHDNSVKVLEKQGYIHINGKRIDIERTIRFLIVSIIKSKKFSNTQNRRGYIFDCGNFSIVVEEDRFTPKKCRIIPIQDNNMLNEYNVSIVSEYGEGESE